MYFYKSVGRNSGNTSSACRLCRRIWMSEYRKKNRDYFYQKNREWVQNHKPEKAKIDKRYADANREYYREYSRQYYIKNML